jgi:hypothetical protein
MAFTSSPNMFLPIPGVGTEQGPNYALDINSSLTLIDQHDHSLGKGVQINPSGLNINSDLTINSNKLTDVGGVRFTALGSNPSDLQFLYVAPGPETPLTEDLWFNDGNGNQVQLTSNGLVNATIASLPGESFAGGTFFWKQGAGSTTPANFDIGSITLRPNVPATTFGVTLSPPTGITSQYTINLPLLPVSQSFLTIDNSGTMVAATPFPLTNTAIAVGTITGDRLVNQTITATQIANNTITTTQISPTAGITGGQIATNTVSLANQVIKTTGNPAVGGNVALSDTSGVTNFLGSTFVPSTAAKTATISIASPAVITVTSTAGFSNGTPVKFSTTGALPTGIVAGTFYYVINVTGTTFNIAATPGGTAINTTGSQSGTHTTTGIIFSATITTYGGPVLISLVPDGTTNPAGIGGGSASTVVGTNAPSFQFVVNGTTSIGQTMFTTSIITYPAGPGTNGYVPPGTVSPFIHVPAAGTWTYHLEGKSDVSNTEASIRNLKIMIYEL